MGQKVNPHGARVGVIFGWSGRWYAGKKDFANYLVEDNKLRKMLKDKYFAAGVHSNGELAESDFEAFAAQCGKFAKTICGICHDRFIIVDQKEIYWTGASLKDAGRLTFAAAKMGAEVIPGLLDSIRNATTERRDYSTGKKAVEAKKGKCD